jgi:hypothetical protein
MGSSTTICSSKSSSCIPSTSSAELAPSNTFASHHECSTPPREHAHPLSKTCEVDDYEECSSSASDGARLMQPKLDSGLHETWC